MAGLREPNPNLIELASSQVAADVQRQLGGFALELTGKGLGEEDMATAVDTLVWYVSFVACSVGLTGDALDEDRDYAQEASSIVDTVLKGSHMTIPEDSEDVRSMIKSAMAYRETSGTKPETTQGILNLVFDRTAPAGAESKEK